MLSTLTSKLLKSKCQLAISYISDLDKPPTKKKAKKTSNIFSNIVNYRFLTTETNSKALYILRFLYNLISKSICNECADFCLQIFVYNCVLGTK